MKLRPYQEQAVDETRQALAKYKRVLFQLPTGGGKTVVFSNIALLSQKYNRRVLIVSNRTEILMQNGGALERMGLDLTYINPKGRKIPTTNIAVGMAQTLKRRVEKEDWVAYLRGVELAIFDECHECTSDFLHEYFSDKCFVLGVTATPRRYGKMKQLGSLYKAMVQVATVKDLLDLKFLAPSKLYSISAPKLDIPIDKSIGDYNQKMLAQKFETKTNYTGVVKEWLRLTPNQKTICFCVSSVQAIAITKEFVDNGVSARYLLSGTFDEDDIYSGERKEVMDSFKRSEFTVLVNVGIAVAGLDVPDIRVVIANFATISITKWKQALGRGARICEGKTEFTILDCGANYQKLGRYEDEPIWNLWHDEHSGEGVQAVKTCGEHNGRQCEDIEGKVGCGELVPTTCKVCPNCGWIFVTDKYEYQMYLEEVAKDTQDSTASYCAQKKLEGWSIHRIFVQVCLANAGQEHKAFVEACKALQVSEKYWYPFKTKIWSKIKNKKV